MKVTLTPMRVQRTGYTSQVQKSSALSRSQFVPQVISFSGGNSEQIMILAAEAGPYFKIGGVATVLKDYLGDKVFPDMRKILVMPYYNGQRYYKENGELEKAVSPLVDENGKFFVTNANLKSVPLADSQAPRWELEKIASKKMNWAGASEDIILFRVKGTDHYMVYTDDTARMPKPYADGSYSSGGLKRQLGDGGDPYAKFCKAVAEFQPDFEKNGVNPRHILLNDPQTAFYPEYVAARVKASEPVFPAKISFVQHNLGPGYQGDSSFKDMFLNFATNDQANAVWHDQDYFEAVKAGKEEDYFAEFFRRVTDDDVKTFKLKPQTSRLIQNTEGQVVTSMIPIRYTLWNNLTAITPVSERYADHAIENAKVALGLTPFLAKLKEMNRYRGILNGLSDPNINPMVVNGLRYYGNAKGGIGNVTAIVPDKDLAKETDSYIEIIKKEDGSNEYKYFKKEAAESEKFVQVTDAAEIEKIKSSSYVTRETLTNPKTGKQETKFYISLHDNNGRQLKTLKTYDPKWYKNAQTQEQMLEVLDKIQKIKKENKIELFKRLQEGVDPRYSIGKYDAKFGIIGSIDSKILEALENQKDYDVNLFVSWGRGDDQKGLDTVLQAFKKFLSENQNNPKAANSVLVLGGEIDGMAAEQVIKMTMESYMSDNLLKGRVVFMNGFAPNTILAAAADAAVFPSRFAPCELTDLEAMKYGATPLVTELQGLAQKNFDPRKTEESARATSYKTPANAFMSIEEISKRDAAFVKLYDEEKAKIQKELDLAQKKDSSGKLIPAFNDEAKGKLLKERLEKSEVIRVAQRKASDRLVVEDLAAAMLAKVDETPTLRAQMMTRAMEIPCGWDENGALHGTGEKASSTQIYKRFHLENPSEKFTQTIFDYDRMPTTRARVSGDSIRTGNLLSSRFDSFGSSKFFNKRVLGAIAGVVLIGGIGYHFFKKKSKAQKHPSSFIA